jgi:hypothetical protein
MRSDAFIRTDKGINPLACSEFNVLYSNVIHALKHC